MKEYWFKHHGKASADPRMKLLKETFGYAGIGVYWEIVEYIETWGDGQFPLKELVAAIRSPRVSEKMLRSPIAASADNPLISSLEELQRRKRRAEEELEEQRRRLDNYYLTRKARKRFCEDL